VGRFGLIFPLVEAIMIQIRLKQDCRWGSKGDVIQITRNIAHTLIDKGEGELLGHEIITRYPKYQDKMMRGRK
jgi:hypothetical protein